MESAGNGRAHLSPRSSLRSKLLFIFGALIVIGIATIYAKATERALYIRSVSSSEFNQYVIAHHIGNAQQTSDYSGLEGDFCVLHLNQPLAATKVQPTAVNLLYHYHDLDGGTNLTIDYRSPVTHKTVIVADAIYDHSSQIVYVNLRNHNNPGSVKVHVNWVDGWYGN